MTSTYNNFNKKDVPISKEKGQTMRVATSTQRTQLRTHCQVKEGNHLRCSKLQLKLDPR